MLSIAASLLLCVLETGTIVEVEFENLTYPGIGGLTSCPMKDGDYCSPDREVCATISAPAFGDLDGDGLPEAAIALRAVFKGGNGSHSAGLVYALVDGKPKLIGRFAGGDRALGGILGYWIRKRRLIVERERASCSACRDGVEVNVFEWKENRLVLVESWVERWKD